MGAAEKHTGITSQQVSRWAKALKDRDIYRAKLFTPSYRKAMGAVDEHRLGSAAGLADGGWG